MGPAADQVAAHDQAADLQLAEFPTRYLVVAAGAGRGGGPTGSGLTAVHRRQERLFLEASGRCPDQRACQQRLPEEVSAIQLRRHDG